MKTEGPNVDVSVSPKKKTIPAMSKSN